MTKLLLRLFVKQPDAPQSRNAIGQMAGITGIICNLLLFSGKMLAGILSGSVSITADALNNLSDAASSIVTLLGFRLAKRPADADHPYGHGRYEYLSGLAVSVLILFIGFELLKSSISKIIQPASADYSLLVVTILLISIGLKLWMSLFFRKLGLHIDSAALKATGTDCLNDVISTVAVLLGCLVEFLFDLRIDGYIGVLVSLFILYSGIKSARQTISPLLGSQADEALIRQLSEMILSHDKIIGIHDLLIHDYGPGQCYASVHAEVSAKYDPMVCHDILDHIENEVLHTLNIQLVIHFDPIPVDDADHTQLQQNIALAAQLTHPEYSVHDLRISRDKKRISFDLTVPFGHTVDVDSVEAEIKGKLDKAWQDYALQIQIDRN